MKRQYDDDDGRTIANMDVDGMPWYSKRKRSVKKMPMIELSKEERKGLYSGIFKAVALVALVFIVVFFLFIFLLTRIWN